MAARLPSPNSFSPARKPPSVPPMARSPLPAFAGGGLIGVLGGLIGLGGAEFRLPLLIGPFRFRALEAVILNKAMSLVVVATGPAVPGRDGALHDRRGELADDRQPARRQPASAHGWGPDGRRSSGPAPCTVFLAVLLVLIAVVLVFGHGTTAAEPLFSGNWQIVAGDRRRVFAIGVVASLMGVAGGELLISDARPSVRCRHQARGQPVPGRQPADHDRGLQPRYSRDSAFGGSSRGTSASVLIMAIGSIVGTFIGGHLLGIVPDHVLLPILALILVVSSVKVWRHG